MLSDRNGAFVTTYKLYNVFRSIETYRRSVDRWRAIIFIYFDPPDLNVPTVAAP